jgi:putative DNA primase/helicase
MMKAALILARSGVLVFPCNADDKSPRTTHGFHDATTDLDIVRAWSWDDALIGAAIGEGQIVIDVDPRNGGDDTLALFSKLPRTRTTKTRSGGRHYWLHIPKEITLRGTLGPGIDVKRPGKGYVIVPPSPGYAYIRGGELARAPQWLLDELVLQIREDTESAASPKFFPFEVGTAYGVAALRNAITDLEAAPEGSRNDALNKAAFGLAQLEAGGELSRHKALEALVTAAEGIGLGKWEIRNTIESGWSAGEIVPRQAPERVTS